MKTQKQYGRCLIAVVLFAVLVCLDLMTKLWAQNTLPEKPIVLIQGVFELRYLENRGAAFGMLQNRQWIFVVFAICCVILCCWYVFRLAAEDRHLASAVCLSVLAAGASGNLIDRVARGSVIDFIYVSLIHFPVFNVADICVSVSTIVLVFLVLFYYKEDV